MRAYEDVAVKSVVRHPIFAPTSLVVRSRRRFRRAVGAYVLDMVDPVEAVDGNVEGPASDGMDQ